MSHKRVPKRKIVFAGAGAAAIAAAAILLPNANASQDDKTEAAQPKKVDAASAADIAAQLASQLGEAFGGAYYDKDKQQVIVNVVGDNNHVNVEVKSAGAVAEKNENSAKALQTAAKTLRTEATIPGTAWSVDPKTNELRVTADSTVTGAKWQFPVHREVAGRRHGHPQEVHGRVQALRRGRRRHLRRRRALLARLQRHHGQRRPGVPHRRSLRRRRRAVVGLPERRADRHRAGRHLPR
ncbi:hypothetical protein SANTM175S_10436 [Streptomyces antimycoticus]